ncbi:MAG: class I SAM-dependent methyltransferase [Candidatus Dojkabacteria bacterium]
MKDKEIKHYDRKELWEKLKQSQDNKERIEKTARMIPEDVTSIADIGCGNGLFLRYINDNLEIDDLVGVDFSEKAMEELKLDKKVGDITNIPLGNNSYDLVSALEVLEHLDLDEYQRAREELIRVSRGYILVSTPFNEDLELEFVKCPKCKTEFNSSHHKWSFTEERIRGLFEDRGYDCIGVEYISKRNIYLPIDHKKIKAVREYPDTVCPVCGYEIKGETKSGSITTGDLKDKTLVKLVKKILPKRETYKWIVGLYKSFSNRLSL